jgi:hypothetical protein
VRAPVKSSFHVCQIASEAYREPSPSRLIFLLVTATDGGLTGRGGVPSFPLPACPRLRGEEDSEGADRGGRPPRVGLICIFCTLDTTERREDDVEVEEEEEEERDVRRPLEGRSTLPLAPSIAAVSRTKSSVKAEF